MLLTKSSSLFECRRGGGKGVSQKDLLHAGWNLDLNNAAWGKTGTSRRVTDMIFRDGQEQGFRNHLDGA